MAQGGNCTSTSAKYGRTHPGKCRNVYTSFSKCEKEGHFMKECSKSQQGNVNQGSRSQCLSVALQDTIALRVATSGTGRIAITFMRSLVVKSKKIP